MSTSKALVKGKILRPTKEAGELDSKPLWNHVKVLHIPPGGGGNRVWSCNYCNKQVTGSYSKVKAHLLKIPLCGVQGCQKLSDHVLEAIKKEHEDAESRHAAQALAIRKKSDYISLPEGSDLKQHKKRKGSAPDGPLQRAFNIAERDIVDKRAARMFYASALSFNLSRCPYFRKYSEALGNSKLSGYVPPSYDRLRTTLLAQEKAHVMRKLQPIKDTWKKKGVSLCSDGWSDRQRRPLINIMAASEGGAMFIKAIDSSGIKKDADYVAKLFIPVIEEVGHANIVQIITDNGSNFKAAGGIIEDKYPQIFWTPCVVHSLNLAIKSMCDPTEKTPQYAQCKWIADLIHEVEAIRNFIVNHQLALSIYNRYSNLSLLRIAETRFASSIIMAKRLRDVKESLEKMVMDASWRSYRGDGKTPIEAKAHEVKQCIVNDSWWDKIDYFLSFTEPIVDMLRAANTDAAVFHLVYDMWDTMIEKVKAVIFEHEGKAVSASTENSDFFDVIYNVLVARWNKNNTPLQCMTPALVPKFYSEAWLRGGINGSKRVAPHEDEEISLNMIKCFKRLFPTQESYRNVCIEYGAFSSASGYFNQPHVNDARAYEEPISWWANHGASIPLLRDLAFRLLSQPASSSCCERNWSTYSLIQSIKRNKLTTTRAEDLVFVHCNIRLLSRRKKKYKEGDTKYWDLCGDKFDVDIGSIIKLAELSLNEPELETVSFDDTYVQEDDTHVQETRTVVGENTYSAAPNPIVCEDANSDED